MFNLVFYKASFEFLKMKEIFKGEPEWEKAFALFHCLNLRDTNTAKHSIEVGYFAAKIAAKLNLDPSRYFLAGLLHDIGKIDMDDHPLKSGEILTVKERSKLKDHVLHGVLTLSELGFGKDIVQFCLRHHERLDGSGYPFGVCEELISTEGRIAQVSDVFSALTSPRKYRENPKAYSYDEALLVMKNDYIQQGIFDGNILNILVTVIQDEKQKEQRYA